MNGPIKTAVRRDDGLDLLALFLAFLIMICPTEADILDVLLRRQKFLKASILAVLCFAVVFTPFFLSIRRRRREPHVLRPRAALWATGVILGLNVLAVGTLLVREVLK